MRYDKIPTLSIWNSDSYTLLKPPIKPAVKNVQDLLDKYNQAFTPMAKRNMLQALDQALQVWNPFWGAKTMSWKALDDAVKRAIAYDDQGSHRYDRLLCIGYKINLGKFDKDNKVVYSGNLDDERDMRQRADGMLKAIDAAWTAINASGGDDSKTLKIFMAPEFYFRGTWGAYPPDIVSQIMPYLRRGGTGKPIYKDWLFVFGTAISAAVDARQHCFTCNNAANIVFERDPNNRAKTIAKCKNGATHQVEEGIYGAVIDNVALIQRGSEEYLVAKEYVSHIDFRKYKVVVPTMAGGQRQIVDVRPTEGARPRGAMDPNVLSSLGSDVASKFVDERMGGALFTFDGIKFGLEVCLDHMESGGRLNGGPPVQIMLIPSAGMSIKHWRTVDEGITFNVDGLRPGNGQPACQVVVKSGAGALEAGTQHRAGAKNGALEVYGPFDIPY